MEPRYPLLIQLPVPQLNFARQTGNIPFGAACLKMAAEMAGLGPVQLLPESLASYLGDAALLERIVSTRPGIVGFSVYAWNLDRSLHLAQRLKSAYQPLIIFGGPEITPDNQRIRSSAVDYYLYGEGEVLFTTLLKERPRWAEKSGSARSDAFFQQGHSPYPAGFLEPEIENMILIETQRGCPHRCGYCYYGKARQKLSMVPGPHVIDTLTWALDRGIAEAYLLDPCLNARKDLDDLLAAVARVNTGHRIQLISEIRAEAVDDRMADRLAAAGFTWFEIGLQSVNPTALKQMNRPTDLKAFLQGVQRLNTRGIKTGIDLIAGLPGDDPDGFSQSVGFLLENGLADDVQVFPLSILPGTPFRKRCHDLGIVYAPSPPYIVIETPTFSDRQIAAALDEAQERFDLSLYPFPDLDLSGCTRPFITTAGNRVCLAEPSGMPIITKTLINQPEALLSMDDWTRRLAHPYQLVFGPGAADTTLIGRVIQQASAANPFTPFEIVFVEPNYRPDIQQLLAASRLRRPHYLDNDLRFLYPDPGNRAVLFTLLTKQKRLFFQGEMQRQVFWWQETSLPSRNQLDALATFDGIFIPDAIGGDHLRRWQTRMAVCSQDLPEITFADPAAQKIWVRLTRIEDYWLDLLPDA